MFRYIGFEWNPAIANEAGVAQHFEDAIRQASGWRPALSRPGLHVYTIGDRPGVNSCYPLQGNQGVVLGRLFRRQDEPHSRGDIVLSPNECDRILEMNGRALVSDYWGRYVAVLASRRQRTLVLRDPSGTLPCYRVSLQGVNIFFSWLDDFIAFAPGRRVPCANWDAIAALLSLGNLGGRETALEGVLQILPGQLTCLSEDATPPMPLWSVVQLARRPIDEHPAIAAARLRQVVANCTQAWSCCHESILLRLSGGVDSAILLGSLSITPAAPRIVCLNYHSPGSDSDERGYARLAAAKAGVQLIERERDVTFRLDEILSGSLTPTPENHLGRMDASHIDAEVAATHQASAMLTGAGGDQLFFQLRNTWPAADYLSVHGWDRGFIRAALEAARLGRVSLWQSMRQAMANRHHRTSPSRGIGRLFTLVRREAVDCMPHLDRHIHPDLASASDLPIGKFNQVQQLINAFPYYDPYLREAAPELVNPLLSQPLIELCLAFPTWLLTDGGRGRALARRAFANELPREIARRQSKGGMEEHVATILRRNLPLARELLLDGQLVRRGLLDREKVEAALANKLSALDGCVGEIHHHIAIEAWLQKLSAACSG